jgi:hypothetical protein
MKNYIMLILILGVVLISGCAKPEVSVSRSLTFWGTATIEAEILENRFPDESKLILKVSKILGYSNDKASEQMLFEGDEIAVFILGEVKPKCTQELIEKPGKVEGEILIELGEKICDETIDPYKGWVAPNLEEKNKIQLQVRLEGSTPNNGVWMSFDNTISLIG